MATSGDFLLATDGDFLMAMGISEAARSVGYSSLSHFINEFKRRYGVTPREYADMQRGFVPMQLGPHTGCSIVR